MGNKVIAIDFDGVIAKYDHWQGLGVCGDIIPGTIEALEHLEANGWQIIIYTARRELELIRQYLVHHAIPFCYVTNDKPPAHVYIDDRAIQFNGNWDEILPQLEDFQPWYHRVKKTPAHRLEPLELYRCAGKIGPWARGGAEGVRFLATGSQKSPVYWRILGAEKEGGNWRYLRVRLEGNVDIHSCWCGTNIYEEA